MLFFFFFQAEDGIRDVAVTGVQTCALPIYAGVIDLALDEPPRAALDFELPIGELDTPVRDHMGRGALHLEALEDVPVAARVMGLGAPRPDRPRVVDDEIGVGADRDGALPRIEAEDAGRV